LRRAPSLAEFPRYPITAGLALLAIVVTAAWWLHMDISPVLPTAMIRRGEWWRLVTGILPHVNLLHLVFNLYWLWVFGTILEVVFGPIKTAALMLLFALGSSAMEFAFLSGGVGLSGVGYGLFGLLWILSTRDERFRDAVDAATVQLFVFWFFICIVATITDIMPVGNIAHGGGAVLGILTGFAIATPRRRIAIASAIGVVVLLALGAATLWRPAVNMSREEGYEEGSWGYDALIAGRNEEAVRWLRDAVAYRSNVPERWFNLGLAYERLHDGPSAIHAYRIAAEAGFAAAQSHLGALYEEGGAGLPQDAGQALDWYRKATAHDDPAALNDVAWTFATSTNPAIRNPQAALEYAEKAVALTKQHPNAAYVDTLAEAYFANGRYADAAKTEEEAIALASADDRARFQHTLERYQRMVTDRK